MSDLSRRIRCPDCQQEMLMRNLSKHYKRYHPGLDPDRRMRDTAVRKERRVTFDSGPPAVVLAIFAFIAVVLLVIAGLLIYGVFNDAEGVPDSRKVFFAASDGAVINGTFYPSGEAGSHTIYLFHDLGEDRSVWGDYPRHLQGEGYNVMAIDLRGHGESTQNVKSGDIVYDYRTMSDADFNAMIYDLIGAKNWVQGETGGRQNTDASEFGAVVVTGKLGTVIFNQAARLGREMRTAVVMSPVLSRYGIDMVQASEDWGDVRPLLLAAGQEDTPSMDAMEAISDNRPENSRTLVLKGDVSGARIIDDPGVRREVLDLFTDAFSDV